MKALAKSYKVGLRVNSIFPVVFFATISVFLPGLLRAQEPAQIVQYRQRITQIDGLIVERNTAISARNGYISQWTNWINAGMYSAYGFDRNRYNTDRNYRAGWDAYIAQQRQLATQYIRQWQTEIAQWQTEIKKLQDDRAWFQWGIQSYYNPGGGGSVASQNTGGTAGNAAGPGLLGQKMGSGPSR